jgi:nucleotide-binding universal stress UspA family protein
MTGRPKIVVGIDGSSRGDDALAFASVLARAVGTRLLLAHAYGPGEDRERARAIVESRRAGAGDVAVETVAYADPSPARALHRVAAARRAALIVVGSSHRARLGLVLPGSIGQQLLRHAVRAVGVVPSGWRPPDEAPLRRIGCGYDGSPQSEAALETAAALTRAVGGRLDVMRAFWSAPLSGPLLIVAAADLESRARGGLGEAVQALPADVNAHARVLLNEPTRALVACSRDLDLLVLGSRGMGPLSAVWAGSVSSRVMREASCPVIAVPRRVLPALIEPASSPASARGLA